MSEREQDKSWRGRWKSRLARWRGYDELGPITGKKLASTWLPKYFRALILQRDALGFIIGGLITGLIADFFSGVENVGEGALVGLTAIGFAALAVVLTALTIFVTFVNDTYLRVINLQSKGGMSGYLIPYLSTALVSTATTTFGAIGLLVYQAVHPSAAKAAILGIEVGLVVWAAWGVFQLIVEIAVHGLNRYELAVSLGSRGIPDFDEMMDSVSKNAQPGSGPLPSE